MTKTAQPTAMKFSEHCLPWIVPNDGNVLGVGKHEEHVCRFLMLINDIKHWSAAHMHDGGVSRTVHRNQDLPCTSLPKYFKDGKAMGCLISDHANTFL